MNFVISFFNQSSYNEQSDKTKNEFIDAIRGALVNANECFENGMIYRASNSQYVDERNIPIFRTNWDSIWYGDKENADTYFERETKGMILTSHILKPGFKFIKLTRGSKKIKSDSKDDIYPLNQQLLITIFTYMKQQLINEGIIQNNLDGTFYGDTEIDTGLRKRPLTMTDVADAYGINFHKIKTFNSGTTLEDITSGTFFFRTHEHTGYRRTGMLCDRVFVTQLMKILGGIDEFRNVIGVYLDDVWTDLEGYLPKECTILGPLQKDVLYDGKKIEIVNTISTGKRKRGGVNQPIKIENPHSEKTDTLEELFKEYVKNSFNYQFSNNDVENQLSKKNDVEKLKDAYNKLEEKILSYNKSTDETNKLTTDETNKLLDYLKKFLPIDVKKAGSKKTKTKREKIKKHKNKTRKNKKRQNYK